jgi:hypothetical protein
MCYRIRDLDRPREKAAQQRHTPTILSLGSRLNERCAALIAWLRPSPKPTSPVTVTSLEPAAPAEAAAKPVPLPHEQACTTASTTREREIETA